MSEIKGPVKVGFGDADDFLRYRVVVGCPGAIVCEVPADIDGPQEDRDRAHRWAQEIADALNAREELELHRRARRVGEAVGRSNNEPGRQHHDAALYDALAEAEEAVDAYYAAHPEALEATEDA